jgi:ABC-type transporter Mla subunit MlaD
MDQIFRIPAAILSDGISFFFCVIIIWWFLGGLVLLPFARRDRFAQTVASITPNGLATLGVLGTFTGVLIGLLDFDVANVDASVPHLLSGLKVAFTTSIIGMATALIYRVLKALVLPDSSGDPITAGDLHEVLCEIREVSKASGEMLGQVRSVLGGSDNSSLVTEIDQVRRTIHHGNGAMLSAFEDFAGRVADNNQKALIEALQEVVTDFNKNLTEQFGENFAQLNMAVLGLVEWQDRYREHVEALEERNQAAVQSLEKIRDAMDAIQGRCALIPEIMEPLQPVLESMQAQSSMLEAQLEAVASLKDRASEAFPSIESSLENLAATLEEAAVDVTKRSKSAINAGEAAQSEIQVALTKYIEDTRHVQETFSTQLDHMLSAMKDRSLKEFSEHEALIRTSAEKAHKSIQEGWAQSQMKLDDYYGNFDLAMQQELTRAISLLGQNLASLSEKFVEDYTPLTEKLRDVVAIAKDAD